MTISRPAEQLRVVYIAGAQNCGSTLLDALLGQAPGARSLGEMGGFHRYRPGVPCSCQRPSGDCGPCRAVLRAVTATPGLATFQRLSRSPRKERRLHWMVVGTKARANYARAADTAFDAVAAATGADVLIDSSKNAARAAALVHDSRHDVRIVHLIRDGRGHLGSRRRRAHADGRRYLAPLSMVAWLAKNLLIGRLLARRVPPGRYLVCRYEELMLDAAGTLARIDRFAALDTTGVAAAAGAEGVERRHLFEPARRTDYRTVALDPTRLESQRWSTSANLAYWLLGGFVSARWGYDRRQGYLAAAKPTVVHS
ncbi:MAG: sulfotransferase [Acidimicrobiales bacterium]